MQAAHHAPPRSPTAFSPSALLGVLLLAFAACSPAANTSATTVNVRGGDFAFTVDKVAVPAGKVHFVFTNQSTTNPHEVWVYPQNQPRLQEMVRLKESGEDVDEKDYLQGIAGDVEGVPQGQTQSFDATLAPGTYELGCFVTMDTDGQKRNHYSMGMHALLTVNP